MDIVKVLNERKEASILKYLIEANFSESIEAYDRIISILEKNSEIETEDSFGSITRKKEITRETIDDITSILITFKEIDLFEERNRHIINSAVFKALKDNISPVINSYEENGKYIVTIFDDTYVPF